MAQSRRFKRAGAASAPGSEKFMWRLFEGVPRVCRECGKALKVDDVREHRTLYPSNKTDFWCKDCHRRWLDARLEANKAHSRSRPHPPVSSGSSE